MRNGPRTLLAALTLALCPLAAAAQTPVPAPVPAEIAATPIVIGQSYALPSTVMGETREINVWLPPGYGQGEKRYPVVYLLDGGRDQDFQHIVGLAQIGAVGGTMREVIVIGVTTKDRQNELAFRATHDATLVRDYPNHGQSDRFRRFLAEEVKPFVAAHWRTDGDDTVMGESLAGLFVVETLLRQPDLFEAYIAVSPSLWWDDEALSRAAPALLTRAAPTKRRLWLTIADEGGTMQDGVDRLNAALDATPGVTTTYRPMPGEMHATIFHPAALAAFRALFATPPSP